MSLISARVKGRGNRGSSLRYVISPCAASFPLEVCVLPQSVSCDRLGVVAIEEVL